MGMNHPPREELPAPWEDQAGLWEEDTAMEPRPRWRRWVVGVIASMVVAGLAIWPIQAVFDGQNPPVAANGLEVCGFDYCVVTSAMEALGLADEVSRLSNVILDDAAAEDLVAQLIEVLDVEAVELAIVDELGGRLGGVYMPADRLIMIERPANAWVVTHEVAHVVAPGHGAAFQSVLADLIGFVSQRY